MTFSFGILGEIDAVVSTIAFILTIFFLTGFEFLTGALEYVIRENAIYNQMLQRIYKELMIMGFITFVIAIYLAADKDSIFNDYSDEIDFVGYITFFVALFFVAHAMYIMILSMHTSTVYENLHDISVANAIELYTKKMTNNFQNFIFNIPYLPVSTLRQVMEFKIVYSLFRDTYWLPPDFDYGSYLGRSFEKYSLRMINIGLSSWVIMILLCILNYVRIVFARYGLMFTCSNYARDTNGTDTLNTSSASFWYGESDVERRLDSVTHECSLMHLQIFLMCGLLVALYVFSLFLIGRYYLQRLVARAGVTETEDYYKFLILEESITLKQTTSRKIEILGKKASFNSSRAVANPQVKRRMSIGTFRKNVNTLLKETPTDDDKNKPIYQSISDNFSRHRQTSVIVKAFSGVKASFRRDVHVKPLASDNSNGTSSKFIYNQSAEQGQVRKTLKDLAAPGVINPAVPQRKRGNLVIKLNSGGGSTSAIGGKQEEEDVESLTAIEQFKLIKLKEYQTQIQQSDDNSDASNSNSVIKKKPLDMRKSMMLSYLHDKHAAKANNGKKKKANVDMKLSEDFSDVYFFRSPELYFKAVEIAIMLNSLYLSMWACNFISLVNTQFNSSPFLHIVMLGPVLVLLPLLGEIVKVSSLLAAIADLDLDIIGSVLELTEEKTMLVKEVREKILCRIDGQTETDKMIILTQLYNEIDIDGNGTITKWEFRDMLRALSLHYSDYKFKKLFKSIDTNRSGDIDMNELIVLVFPNLAEDLEVQRRADMLRERSNSMEKSETAQHRPRFMSSIKRFSSDVENSKREMSYHSLKDIGGETNNDMSNDSATSTYLPSAAGQGLDSATMGGGVGAKYLPVDGNQAVGNIRMSRLMSQKEGEEDVDEDEDSDASDVPVDVMRMSMLMKNDNVEGSDDDMSVVTIEKHEIAPPRLSEVDDSAVVVPVRMNTLMMDPVVGSSDDGNDHDDHELVGNRCDSLSEEKESEVDLVTSFRPLR